jgi:hypothetical protein
MASFKDAAVNYSTRKVNILKKGILETNPKPLDSRKIDSHKLAFLNLHILNPEIGEITGFLPLWRKEPETPHISAEKRTECAPNPALRIGVSPILKVINDVPGLLAGTISGWQFNRIAHQQANQEYLDNQLPESPKVFPKSNVPAIEKQIRKDCAKEEKQIDLLNIPIEELSLKSHGNIDYKRVKVEPESPKQNPKAQL